MERISAETAVVPEGTLHSIQIYGGIYESVFLAADTCEGEARKNGPQVP
jgi:hypothetical protein